MKIIKCISSHQPSIASLFSSRTTDSLVIAAMLCLLNACSVTPTSIVDKPTNATPAAPAPIALNSGGIYNTGTYRPMLEDRRARLWAIPLPSLLTKAPQLPRLAAVHSPKTVLLVRPSALYEQKRTQCYIHWRELAIE